MTDYGDNQPLLMDYYGFPPELYELKFISRGDVKLSQRVVELYKEVRSGENAQTLYLIFTYDSTGTRQGLRLG